MNPKSKAVKRYRSCCTSRSHGKNIGMPIYNYRKTVSVILVCTKVGNKNRKSSPQYPSSPIIFYI